MKPRLSLSWKIALLAVINVLMVMAVLLIFAGLFFRLSPESFLVAPAVNRIMNVAGQLRVDFAETPVAAREELLQRFTREHGVDFLLVDAQGRSIAGPPIEVPKTVIDEIAQSRRRRPPPPPPLTGTRMGAAGPATLSFRITTRSPSHYWVGVYLPFLRSTDGPYLTNTFLLLRSDSFIGNQFFFDPKPWLALTIAIIIVSSVVWLPLIRSLTHAITQMTAATGQIAEGQFDTRLTFERKDEVGLLASSINSMSGQLAGFVKGQKRFLADIAHELCAPIARMQVALGILEQRAEDNTREYVADVKDEAQHMSELINELMSFSKAGMQMGETEIVPVSVAETVQRVLVREATGDVQIQTSVGPDVAVLANPDNLFRALSNLVRNAIRYAGHAGPISISTRTDGNDIIIAVADSGPGLPESALDEVFAPFYRLEPSRGRDKGGTGLGLAIVRACVEASKGAVHAHNRKPSGLVVEIRLRAA